VIFTESMMPWVALPEGVPAFTQAYDFREVLPPERSTGSWRWSNAERPARARRSVLYGRGGRWRCIFAFSSGSALDP
jgi:hypothetical protein